MPAGAASIALLATAATAEMKVGMITTLSGGGAGLGIDVRDGFMLAVKMSGNENIEVVIEDDQRKPEVAVQLADKMIQSENVDVMTGIIWSNLAMAVIPSAVAQGKFYLSPNAGPSALAGQGCNPNYFNVAWQNDNLHEAAGAYANQAGYTNSFILAPNYPAGQDALTGYKRTFEGALNLTVGDKPIELIEVGPAHTRGDVIVEVNGDDVKDSRDLARKIADLEPDSMVKLAIVRYGDKREVDMTLGSFPSAKKLASLQKEEPADEIVDAAVAQAAEILRTRGDDPVVAEYVEFIESSQRGIAKGRPHSMRG